jgi:glycosyltransferase involved in cell wall biosynthesis
MGCYNGAKYLAEQLDSIEAQTHTNWRLYVSVDGSDDGTMEILQAYQLRWGADRLNVREGPHRGFCCNFLSLAADSSIEADYYAFCDQDDVWLREKLSVAVNYLTLQYPNLPQVYCSRTQYVSHNLKPLGMSTAFPYPRTFRNALVQSIAGGNTMVFNHAAKSLLNAAGLVDVPSHDWWVYILVEAAGGMVFFDLNSYILYRQHPGALVGGNTSLRAKWRRFVMVMQGRFKDWNSKNIAALYTVKALIEPHNLQMMGEFKRLRNSHVLHRMRMISVCGLYRQGWHGTISLFFAALVKKI